MRNYVGELRSLGLSFRDIAKETGISKSSLQRIESGRQSLVSGTDKYETIRNYSRRASYQIARRSDLTVEQAREIRRALPDPDADVPLRRQVTKAKALFAGELYTLWLRALFQNTGTGAHAVSDGESTAYKEIDYTVMTGEAIDNAIKKLAGTGWELVRILATELRTLKLEAK